MGMVFRLMVFLLMFNLATMVLTLAFGYNAAFLNNSTGMQQASSLNATFSQSSGVPVEESTFWYRFLDVISLGFYNKIMVFLNSTIFSIPALLVTLNVIPEVLAGFLKAFISIISILGMFELFTGRDLFGK